MFYLAPDDFVDFVHVISSYDISAEYSLLSAYYE